MTQITFRFALLLGTISFIALILSVDTAPILHNAGGRFEQAVIWNQHPRLRTLLALELLFFALPLGVLGLLGMFWFKKSGRLLFLLSLFAAFGFFLVEPRYQEGDWPLLLRGILLCCLGAFFEKVDASLRRQRLATYGLILSGLMYFLISVVLLRLLTHASLAESLSWNTDSLLLSLSLFSGGLLLGSAYFGGAREVFLVERDSAKDCRRFKRRLVLCSLVVQLLLFMLLSFVFLAGSADRLYWTLVSPAVSLFMAFYSPMTWLTSTQEVSVFGNELLGPIEAGAGNARLYLGIFFQYISLFAASCIVLSLRKKPGVVLLVMTHLSLLIYLLPSLWFVRELGLRSG